MTSNIVLTEHSSFKVEPEIPKIEEELKEIESKRREIRIEVLMLRVQRHNYRTYLVELKNKVKEKARAKRKMDVREKKNNTNNEAYSDALEILSHNCIKMTIEHNMAIDALSFAMEQFPVMRKTNRKVDVFIMKSEAEIEQMRHLIMKK